VALGVLTVTDAIWEKYLALLRDEPSDRAVHYMMSGVRGTLENHPKLEPHLYPDEEAWAEVMHRLREPGAPLALLCTQFERTIQETIKQRVQHYREEARSRIPPKPREKVTPDLTRASQAGSETLRGCSTSWRDIEISFLSEFAVQITWSKKSKRSLPLNYSEMGFADNRTGNPSSAWLFLRRLAEAKGVEDFGRKIGPSRSKVQKDAQAVRSRLKALFSIAEDPLKRVDGVRYEAQFKISCALSYNNT
jgi:hypothetical protein